MSTRRWDILVCTIPHRHDKLLRLLAELNRQISVFGTGPAGVIVYRDNLQASYGDKCQALMEASRADYISWADDDDMVAPDFIHRVLKALAESEPDYVGFPVRFTSGGVEQMPVHHSLRYDGWTDTPDLLMRDIAQFNPIRRKLAMLGRWEGGWEAERRWARQVRDTGLVIREEWIPDPMYYYQWDESDTFRTERKPLPDMPPLPAYPWMSVL